MEFSWLLLCIKNVKFIILKLLPGLTGDNNLTRAGWDTRCVWLWVWRLAYDQDLNCYITEELRFRSIPFLIFCVRNYIMTPHRWCGVTSNANYTTARFPRTPSTNLQQHENARTCSDRRQCSKIFDRIKCWMLIQLQVCFSSWLNCEKWKKHIRCHFHFRCAHEATTKIII